MTHPPPLLSCAVFSTSLKEHERRLALHPEDITTDGRIPAAIKRQLFLEKGYGARFGFSDAELLRSGIGGMLERAQLFDQCDMVILPKPVLSDLLMCRPHQIIVGWLHFCAQRANAQAAIDRRLTALTWEGMHNWVRRDDGDAQRQRQEGEGGQGAAAGAAAAGDGDGWEWKSHVFSLNNRTAGYAAVHHALNLAGRDGIFGHRASGRPDKVAVIGRGNCAIGAIFALHGRGYYDVTVYSHQAPGTRDAFAESVATGESDSGLAGDSSDPTKRVRYHQVDRHPFHDEAGGAPPQSPATRNTIKLTDGGRLIADELCAADIIVNAILQDPIHPILLIRPQDVPRLQPRCLVIDVSCDAGMGFPFARPTSFDAPTFQVPLVAPAAAAGGGAAAAAAAASSSSSSEQHEQDASASPELTYYSVDHTPSYLYDAATRDISNQMLQLLPDLLAGAPDAWASNPTLSKALEIHDGVVLHKPILQVQHRAAEYPHAVQE